jgi:hypothetical protein
MKEIFKVNGKKYYQSSGMTCDDMILKDENGKEYTWDYFEKHIYGKGKS